MTTFIVFRSRDGKKEYCRMLLFEYAAKVGVEEFRRATLSPCVGLEVVEGLIIE